MSYDPPPPGGLDWPDIEYVDDLFAMRSQTKYYYQYIGTLRDTISDLRAQLTGREFSRDNRIGVQGAIEALHRRMLIVTIASKYGLRFRLDDLFQMFPLGLPHWAFTRRGKIEGVTVRAVDDALEFSDATQ